jgi:hypothetical protein
MALPRDGNAYTELVGRIVGAPTGAALVALAPDLVAFEGGRFLREFTHYWVDRWAELEPGPVPAGVLSSAPSPPA